MFDFGRSKSSLRSHKTEDKFSDLHQRFSNCVKDKVQRFLFCDIIRINSWVTVLTHLRAKTAGLSLHQVTSIKPEKKFMTYSTAFLQEALNAITNSNRESLGPSLALLFSNTCSDITV
jgi:hypothetical protein